MSKRKITVDGKVWEYEIGSKFCVARSAEEKRLIDLSALTGLSWADIERGRWKRWFRVTPKDIASWLVTNS